MKYKVLIHGSGSHMKYKVLVHGSVWLETNDELLAHAYAENIRACGWKGVNVNVD